ncbi:hypothetical protein GCK32_005094 [Trichostrongylus colubriformis]|uniref:C-type lectin domain-containing protein n=1 Tax=Trichostrongylus colubriformis TaxID=6319 RepID=A0AAN8EWL1_TRICO
MTLLLFLVAALIPAPGTGERTKRFRIHLDKMTFDEAREFCARRESWPVTINSQKENDFIHKIAVSQLVHSNTSMALVWIGLRRVGSTWEWSDDNPVNYTNWWTEYGQPDNYKGNENCVQMYVDGNPVPYAGRWNDLNCDHKAYFVCQYYRYV